MSKKTVEKEISSAFDCLAVTQVQVFPFKEGPSMGHMLGLATIVLNDQFQVRGLRIMDGEHGLYVGYPNDPFYKGEDFRKIVAGKNALVAASNRLAERVMTYEVERAIKGRVAEELIADSAEESVGMRHLREQAAQSDEQRDGQGGGQDERTLS